MFWFGIVSVVFSALGLAQASCGNKPFANVDDAYVVGGHDARAGAWPWQASLQTLNGFHFCGGSLIHPQWVLTASHCVQNQSPGKFKVVMGEHNLRIQEGHEQTFSASQVFVHERFQQGGWMHNDVALVKLSKPVQLNQFVNLVCLPERGSDEQGRTTTISGWGYTSKAHGNVSPNILQEVSGPIWQWSDCQRKWSQANFQLNPKVYCFGNKDGKNYGVCNGDSGGPMNVNHNGKWSVVGVAHFAEGKCQNLPGAYTKVEPYLDWIKNKVPIGDGGTDQGGTVTSRPGKVTDAPGKVTPHPPRPTPPRPDIGKCTAAGQMVGVADDCSAFIMCTTSSGGVRINCSGGLLFNTKNGMCDWAANVHRTDCNMRG